MQKRKQIAIILALSLFFSGICNPEVHWGIEKTNQITIATAAESATDSAISDGQEEDSEEEEEASGGGYQGTSDADIHLYEGASGYIDLDMNMPDLYFSPEEDGAFLLSLGTELISEPSVSTVFYFYELIDGTWKKIDYIGGPGYGRNEEGDLVLGRRLPNYYEAGKKYKISFAPVEFPGDENCTFHYTFEKTDLAGIENGMVWRMDTFSDTYVLEDIEISVVRYLGDAQILQIPGMIQGYPVRSVDCESAFYDNTTLQVITFAKEIKYIDYLFPGNGYIVELYIYNSACKFTDSAASNYGWEYAVYGYSGSTIEKFCAEHEWNFVSLGEAPVETREPLETLQPTETPKPTSTLKTTSTPKPTSTPKKTPAGTFAPTKVQGPGKVTTAPRATSTPMNTVIPTDTASGMSENPQPSLEVITDSSVEEEESASLDDFQLKINVESVLLKWKESSSSKEYWIYRSQKKNGQFQRIKKLTGKNSFRDKSVVSGKTYFYQVKEVEKKDGIWRVREISEIKVAKIPCLQAPELQIKKGTISGKRYVKITLKKYQGKNIEIYYRKGKKKFSKLVLQSNSIAKQKGCFRIRYLSTKENLYFKIRTYYKSGKKKIYSKYSKEMKVKV